MSPKGREGFPKTARLRKRPEFLRVSRAGRKIHSANFIVISQANDTGATRLGVTVSGKVGNAVERNWIKRRLREFFRRHRRQMPPGVDLLVIARKSATGLPYSLIENELEKTFVFQKRPPKS